MDRLRAIKYFIEVAEKKSFRGAAKSFSVPASSVSRRIQELEATLGAALVHRTTRVVRLTELGRVYLDHVRSAVAALDYADELVSANPNQPSGTLRITASPDYGRICVVPVLTKLKRTFPDIVLDIELTDQVSNLASNDVDLAIRATAELPARSVARKLSDNRFFLVASPQYIDSYGCPSNLAELATHRTLIYRRPDGLLHWQAKTDVGWRELRTVHAYISNQGDALVENALAGTGIALVPQWGVEKYISEGSLVNIALCDAKISISRNPNSGLYLLYQQPKYALQKVKVAVDFLISELSPNSD